MKEPVLVVIKPEGLSKALLGTIFLKLERAKVELVAIKTLRVTRRLAQEHYCHLKGQPFYQMVINHMLGKYHKSKNVVAMIFRGENAIKKCRRIAGATNPKEADPSSIRGAYGRVTRSGLFENLLHVSSDRKEAEREIKLWFEPKEILVKLYPAQIIPRNSFRKYGWA